MTDNGSRHPKCRIVRIVTGGQTGVDRAALDIAVTLGIPTGGRIPKGRWSESGPIPDRYSGLVEIDVGADGDPEELALRTRHNILGSDATLILEPGGTESEIQSPGTQETAAVSAALGRTIIRAWLTQSLRDEELNRVHRELTRFSSLCLNVAGPRESEAPGIYRDATVFLSELFRDCLASGKLVEDAAQTRHLIEQGLQNLRHWDTIRWLVPFFYFTLSGGAALVLTNLHADGLFQLICLSMVVIGLLCWLLVNRTVRYHENQVNALKNMGIRLNQYGIAVIDWSRSATRAFVVAIGILIIGWFTATIFEPDQVRSKLGFEASLSGD